MTDTLTDRVLAAGATVGDLSGSALTAAVDRLADRLDAAGVVPGETLGLRGANRADWLIALLALLRGGARPVLMAHDSPDPEVIRTLAAAGGSRCLLLGDDELDWLGDPVAGYAPAPHEETVLLATSGSTGVPKLVARSGRSLLAEGARFVAGDWARSTDTILLPLPMTHSYALGWAVAAMLAGARLIPVPARAVKATRQELADGATVVPVVPGLARILLRQLGPSAKTPELRLMMAGAGYVEADLDSRWTARTGIGLARNYGSTETGAVLAGPGGLPSGYVGSAMPGVQVRLRAENSTWVDGPGVGEVVVTLEDGTERAMGDLARRDESGQLQIIGRRSTNAVRRGARWVSTNEVGSVLATAYGVADVLVTGSSTEDDDATLVAEFVPAGRASTAETLAAHARANLAPYKVPNVFRARRRIRRNAIGKSPQPLSYQLASGEVVAEAVRAYRRSELLFCLTELGALPALAAGRTATELAAELGLDPESTAELLTAGQELGLVTTTGSGDPVEASELARLVRAERELRPLIHGPALAAAARLHPAPAEPEVLPAPGTDAEMVRVRPGERAVQFGSETPRRAEPGGPDAPAESYDVCFVVDAVHGPYDDLIWLAQRLRPGGRLVIEDRFLDAPEPVDPTLFLAWVGAGRRSWFRLVDLQLGLESVGLWVETVARLDDTSRSVVVCRRDR